MRTTISEKEPTNVVFFIGAIISFLIVPVKFNARNFIGIPIFSDGVVLIEDIS